jgi:hypothetical protein
MCVLQNLETEWSNPPTTDIPSTGVSIPELLATKFADDSTVFDVLIHTMTKRHTNERTGQCSKALISTFHDVTQSPKLRRRDTGNATTHLLLILSSCFFMIPGLYALLNGIPLLSLLSLITTIVSINYWRDAVDGWRRHADLLVAKISFIIYFTIGVVHVRDWHILVVGWPNTALMLSAYFMSNRLWNKGSQHWIYCHMAFHFFVSVGQLVVVHGSYVLYR